MRLFKVQKDRYGNDPKCAVFETELARALLQETPTSTFQRLNAALVQHISDTIRRIPGAKQTLEKDVLKYLLSFQLIGSVEELQDKNSIDYLFTLLRKPLDGAEMQHLFDVCNVYFFCFQRLGLPEDSLPDVEKPKTGPLSLSQQAQIALRKDEVQRDRLYYTLMPDSQFSDDNRGRVDTAFRADHPLDFGITEHKDTPEWARGLHQRSPFAAKYRFKRDDNSSVVQAFKRLEIPFIAGPSGTTGHNIYFSMLLAPFDAVEMREFVNLFVGCLIAMGHHSFYEMMLVAANLNLFVDANNASLQAMHFPFDAKKLRYHEFFTEAFKKTEAYAQLQSRYPEYLGDTNVLMPTAQRTCS